ncbi:MAG: AMP-dependent synthetase and ligase [Mycobacterium sp.]|nr:AMP-dependent synthetase and ligase [Mycobacterium sp.]
MLRTKSTLQPQPARFGAARLYRDAGSMASSSVANAVLGMAFWAIAAKMFPPEKLGVMTAVLAVIVSVGVVVAAGVGDAYTALLPAAGPDRPALYRRGQRLFFGLALVIGIGAALATTTWLREVRGSIVIAVLVVVGILAWSALTLQNSTLVALGRARWLPAANVAVSLGKIALLPLLAIAHVWHAVEFSFVLAAILMVAVLRPTIVRVIDSGDDLPDVSTAGAISTRTFDRFVAQTTVSSALSMGLVNVTPFVVTVFSGPKEGALFALSLSIVQALDFMGAALVVSLVVHASSTPAEAGAMARAILIRVLVLAVTGGLALSLVAPTALRWLNPHYGSMGATAVIAVLSVGTVFRCTYMVWAGLQRSRRNMKMPLLFNFFCAVLLLSIMPALTSDHGALGGAIALLLSQLAVITAIGGHVLFKRRRGRRASVPGTSNQEAT